MTSTLSIGLGVSLAGSIEGGMTFQKGGESRGCVGVNLATGISIIGNENLSSSKEFYGVATK